MKDKNGYDFRTQHQKIGLEFFVKPYFFISIFVILCNVSIYFPLSLTSMFGKKTTICTKSDDEIKVKSMAIRHDLFICYDFVIFVNIILHFHGAWAFVYAKIVVYYDLITKETDT